MAREYPERPVVGIGGVVIEGGRALLICRASEPLRGHWSIPGGTLELGESLQQGVVREMREETGLEVRVLDVIEVFDRIFHEEGQEVRNPPRGPRFHYVIVDYLCERISGEARAASDVTDIAFAREEELEKFQLTPTATRVLHKAFVMAREAEIMPNGYHADKPYMLATGEKAVSRLEVLGRIFGPATRYLLTAAGLCSGMRVAEIGCGTGLTAQWVSTQVGAGGSVVGVDSSSEQLRIAEKNAADAGATNLSFREGSAYETGLPRDSFDLVYSRFLLCHLAEPAKALAEMSSLLKRGGILVCEDHDDGGIFTEPPTHAYQRLVEISDAVNRSHGVDSYIGLKLPRLFREAGFGRPEVKVNQIAVLRGEEKRLWELTIREAAPAILAAHASTPEELDAICEEMRRIAQDESILLMLARVTQVWARKA